MYAEIFSLCDAATQQAGKLNILGAFDSIWTKKTPLVLPQCALALRLRCSLAERGIHQISVKFIDMDGKDIVSPITGQLNINFPEHQVNASQNLILNMHGFKIETQGQYSIALFIDNVQITTLPMHIILET